MPTKTITVNNPKFFKYKGVQVYRTYWHDEADQCLSDYWFALSAEADESEHFDVRNLSTWPGAKIDNKGVVGRLLKAAKIAIKEAIKLGILHSEAAEGSSPARRES